MPANAAQKHAWVGLGVACVAAGLGVVYMRQRKGLDAVVQPAAAPAASAPAQRVVAPAAKPLAASNQPRRMKPHNLGTSLTKLGTSSPMCARDAAAAQNVPRSSRL
jgi:hypothetical protein